jgi:antitoxin PrlF
VAVDVTAKMTSKGQITVPKAVRDALELETGDDVLFRVVGRQVVMAKIPDFLDLAGSVPVPPELRGASWEEIRETMLRKRYAEGDW